MNRTSCGVAMIIVSMAIAGAAHGQDDRGFYLAVGLGQAEFFTETDVCDSISDRALNAIEREFGESVDADAVFAELMDGTDCRADAKDSAWRLVGGYRFNPYFALEAGVFDAGRIRVDMVTDIARAGASVDASAEVELELRGVVTTGLVSVPLSRRVSLFGKLGLIAWEGDLSARASGSASAAGVAQSGEARFRDSDEGVDVSYGAGGRLRLSDRLALRAEWTRYEVADLESMMAGLEILFSGGER